ncbi:MAG: kynureninase [candidate division KSB1 bacterium]|nr:kynureninase [candidate division KSB1 bacterium]MDZ7275366.1 kynureninase [candidate division KSB1 bacterium]MDZ7286321.1 kynureninase [candidate division KSB1 bacterium]MDZ7296548.1 kynureninase [candidate division KSB1 bacterium]MDZ7308111.1 kynureninase [candidate division KSB1 bacterium]
MIEYQANRHFALAMDAEDPLAEFRFRFHLPKTRSGEDCVYLCGNSLGLMPKTARAHVEQELSDWERLAVEGHVKARHPWTTYHERFTRQLANLVGARPVEVVAMNTLTVNLHLMMVSFYRPTPTRHQVVMEANAFPSDLYAVQSQIAFHGYDPASSLVMLQPRPGETTLRTEDMEAYLRENGERVALVLLGVVNYYTGQAFDMQRLTRAAHAQGCMIGFDLAHAVGNLLLRLHDWEVDFAVWCSYKYLNAGPGAVAGCFVHERHGHARDLPRFAGWWGHNPARRFLMEPAFQPVFGAEGWQISNPPILSLAPLKASLDLFDEVGMPRLRAKSELLTGYLEFLLNQFGGDLLTIITPADKTQRGAQLSLRVRRNGRALLQALLARNFICDWREPDVIRVAPAPFYNTFLDVYRFAGAVRGSLL